MLVGVCERSRSESYWKIARCLSRKTRAITADETFGVWLPVPKKRATSETTE